MLLKIAFRNALRQKRRTILTALTMFGGFTLAAVSIGWSDGTYNYVIEMFTRNRMGHIQIHGKGYLDKPTLYNTVDNYEALGAKLNQFDGLEAWAPRLYTAGLASVKEKSSAVQIIGIDPDHEIAATRFDKKIVSGRIFSSASTHETIIGKGLATTLQAALGDEVVIVSQAADGSIANDLYRIVGIIESGDVIGDRMALYLHLQDAQALLALEGRVHEIAVLVSNLAHVREYALMLADELNDSNLDVAPWQEFAKSFYQAMRADQEGMWIMLFVIILIVAVGVLNTVLMTVLERRREYGVLKALGTRPATIFALVVLEITIIGLASIVLGCGLGIAINYTLSIYGITIPEPLQYGGVEFQTMYAEVNARSLYIPALTVLLSAALVSFFPSLKAARIEPARAMRMH